MSDLAWLAMLERARGLEGSPTVGRRERDMQFAINRVVRRRGLC